MRSSSLSFSFSLVLGSLTVLSACGGAPPPPAETPKPAASAAPVAKADADGKDAKATKAASLDALVAGEAAKGACEPAHQAALEKLLGEVEAGMKGMLADGKPIGFTLVAKRVMALGSSARSIELAGSARGTEVHVLAYGVHGVSLDVLVGKAAATTLRSPHQRSAASPIAIQLPTIGAVDELESDSRQVTLEPNQPIVVKLTGEGCVAMAAFLKP
ncbi:MAG: hypothetical protein IPF92_23255 [Myxococcales bacterium]|jgi:hypothetical protein|nr:hypothetical protein [Myxococcales bacterium]